MQIKNTTLDFKTNDYLEFRDITEEVEKFVKETKIQNGMILVYSMHTTLSVSVTEHETGIFGDFKDLVCKLIPKDCYYRHNDLSIRTENLVCQSGPSDCLNGYSHCTQLLMRNSETIPIVDGKMVFGKWQRIFMIELDCARKRQIFLQAMGE